MLAPAQGADHRLPGGSGSWCQITSRLTEFWGWAQAQHSTLDGSLWVSSEQALSRQHRYALKPVISPVRNAPKERLCFMGRCRCRQPQDWATWYSPRKACKASELSRRRLKLCNRMQMTMANRTFRNYHHFLEFSRHDCTLSYFPVGATDRERQRAKESVATLARNDP